MINFKTLFQRQLVGLDIGVSGIKAVELSTGKTPRLLAYNRVPLPFNVITSDGELREPGTIVEALKSLFASKVFSTKQVVLGAAGNSVMTKKITLPKMSEEELQHQLFFEAEQYIPYSLEDVNLDFVILGPNTNTQTTGNPMMDVLLVAAKKDYIHSLVRIVEDAGLKTAVVDIQSFALGNAFEFNYGYNFPTGGSSMHAIIDFGAGSTKISIVEGEKTTFTRQLRGSGIACTTAISEKMGIDLDEAERLKVSEPENEGVKPIIQEFIESLTDEIARSIDFSLSQASSTTLNGVYICGGGSRLTGLSQSLAKKVPVEISVLNPIRNVVGSGRELNSIAMKELSYLGTVAVGLALRKSGDST